MSKRNYTQMKQYEAIIMAMRHGGKSRQEIADALGYEMKQKGRPRKDGPPPKMSGKRNPYDNAGVAPLMLRHSA